MLRFAIQSKSERILANVAKIFRFFHSGAREAGINLELMILALLKQRVT